MSSDDYKSSALFYDRVLTPLLRPLRIDIRTFIHYRGYRNVIDVCCGTGDLLQMLEHDSMNLVGVDTSVAMLEKARNRCSEKVALHLLDAEQMQTPQQPFDCAVLSLSLHEKHATRREHIYNNVRRMVRQGGTLILADYSGIREGFKAAVIGDFLTPVIERCAGKSHYQNYIDWNTNGGLEGFLDRHHQPVDVISRPYGGTVLCCAVPINDDEQEFTRRLALLNNSLHAPEQKPPDNHAKTN